MSIHVFCIAIFFIDLSIFGTLVGLDKSGVTVALFRNVLPQVDRREGPNHGGEGAGHRGLTGHIRGQDIRPRQGIMATTCQEDDDDEGYEGED